MKLAPGSHSLHKYNVINIRLLFLYMYLQGTSLMPVIISYYTGAGLFTNCVLLFLLLLMRCHLHVARLGTCKHTFIDRLLAIRAYIELSAVDK